MSEERLALVTGATRGIGRAVLEQLVARGRRVVACGRDDAALSALERASPGRVLGLRIDLAQPQAAAWAVDEAERMLGPLTELVYAAGIARHAPIGEIAEPDLRAQLEVNFVAPFTMLQRAGAMMAERGAGALVAITSTLACRPAQATAAYAASKAALESALRSLALELAPHVRVNGVAPGVVDTDMIRAPRRPVREGERAVDVVSSQLEQLRALHPLGRLGDVRDVAGGVLYLLDAPWVTGTVLTIDGGLTLA